jgi:hypothetical protein
MRNFFNLITGRTLNSAPVPAVSSAAVETYLDIAAATGSPGEARPFEALVDNTRRCADLVSAAPHAYVPARLAHTVAAVATQLARMGDEIEVYVAYYWPTKGAQLARPAAEHLWQAVEQLALTSGLMDVAAPLPPASANGAVDPLAALVRTATVCADQVCNSEDDDSTPVEVVMAIARTLAAIEPLFAPVHSWIAAYIPGRGSELPEAARRHLAEATGRWAPLAGLITHLPAERQPEPETTPETEAAPDSGAEVAVEQTSSEAVEAPATADTPGGTEPQAKVAPSRAKKATQQRR